jgi:hypothetical protein
LFCSGATGGEFEDLDVSEVDFTAFGFEAKVTFPNAGLAHSVHKLPVDGEFHDAVDGNHVIHVPLSGAVTAKLRRHTSTPAWILGNNFQTVSAEEFATDVTWVIGLAILGSV